MKCYWGCGSVFKKFKMLDECLNMFGERGMEIVRKILREIKSLKVLFVKEVFIGGDFRFLILWRSGRFI